MKKLVFLIFLLFAFPVEGNACSCAGTRVPCEAYWNASAVFLGTVSYSRTTTTKVGDFDSRQRVFRFNIDRAFRGVEGGEVEIVTGLGGGDCGYGFQLGGQYLVYAYRNDSNILSTGICSRTRPASEAAEDLAYFRELPTAEPGGTISGEVRFRHSTKGKGAALAPVKEVKIFIVGAEKKYEVLTDDQGNFKVSGVTPGLYKVKVELPEGTSIHSPEREVRISDKGCAQAAFWLEPDTRITGRVLDSQGLPASDVLIELVPVKGERGYPSYARTDKAGRYEITLVPPGRYLLGVRIVGSAGSTYVPFPQTYYPGVSEESRATIISLTEGQRFEANEFILPARFVERELKGIVLDSNGRAVPGATVWLKENQYKDSDMPYRRETDSEGHFSYPVFEGLKYRVNAYIDGPSGARKESDSIELVVSANPETLTLVLR
jgi:hypothetical protein